MVGAAGLRVTVLELPASWGDAGAALARVELELERGAPTDLVLLPEASLTGYVSREGDFDITPFAEPVDGKTSQALAALARRHHVNLVAPIVLRDGARCFNTMAAFDREGASLFTYRKRHPWIPETWATAGAEAAPVIDIEGARVTIAICYDIQFAEEAAASFDDADLLLFPSAWVEEEDSRPVILADLARRHHIAVANANWGPGIVRVPGQGDSMILDANGERLACVARAPVAFSPLLQRVIRADAVLAL